MPPGPSRRKRHRAVTVAAAVMAVLVLGVVAAVGFWSADDDGGDVATEPSTTVAPSTSTSPSTTTATTATTEQPTTTAPTTTTVAPPPAVDTSTAIFPYGSGTVRYRDPVAAARGFAVDFAGFARPIVGEFRQGDTRSGEVEIRPSADGPATTVFVRQLGDDTWWVLGAVADGLHPVRPTTGEPIASPVTVSGTALAFEGHVNVEVRQDGSATPLGSGYVTGSGSPPPGPFEGRITFAPPTEDYGAMVFTTASPLDGQVWQIAAYRIRFA